MLILITGEMHVGKTTIINKIIKEFEDEIAGFCTRPYYEKDIRTGFVISDILDLKEPTKENIIAIIDENIKPIPFGEVFENLGVKLCDMVIKSNKRIAIIDEIGLFERKSNSFISKLHEILKLDRVVIAVLKKRDDSFLNGLKEGKEVIEITLENREEIAEQIISNIKKEVKKGR